MTTEATAKNNKFKIEIVDRLFFSEKKTKIVLASSLEELKSFLETECRNLRSYLEETARIRSEIDNTEIYDVVGDDIEGVDIKKYNVINSISEKLWEETKTGEYDLRDCYEILFGFADEHYKNYRSYGHYRICIYHAA